MIQKYQYEKYGELISSGYNYEVKVKKGYYNTLEGMRKRYRYGTKEERRKRKINV